MTTSPRVVSDVLAAVQGTTVTDLDVEWDGGSLRLRREVTPRSEATHLAPGALISDGPAIVRSAYVGVFHREPDRGFPALGDRVEEQTCLAEVETLGIRNPVRPPVAGTLMEMLVEHLTPVEFGQPLAIVQPAANRA